MAGLVLAAVPSAATETEAVLPADLETITVLPIALSSGIDIEDRQELQANIYKMLLRKLALRGYVLDRPRNWSPPEGWTTEALTSMTASELADATPGNAHYVALLFVERIDESDVVVHSSADATVSAMILDRKAGEILWQRRSSGEHSENIVGAWFSIGLIGMLITNDRYFAFEKAFSHLFEGFPERTY